MLLELRDIRLSFDGVPVLKGVDLDLDAPTLAIIGPSGGGKSTLLRVVAGLLAPDSGTVAFGGRPVDESPAGRRDHLKRIGFVFQSRGLFDHLTGMQNITLPLVHVHGVPRAEAEERASALLSRFGLASEADKRPFQMSGGQQQRVAIARAIATRPDWLLLDEPTSALDPEYTADVLDMLRELQRDGLRFILVTHHMGFARHACESVAFLADGVVREFGPSRDVFERPQDDVVRAFLDKILEWDA